MRRWKRFRARLASAPRRVAAFVGEHVDFGDVVFVLGLSVATAGIAEWSQPAAQVFFGLTLIAVVVAKELVGVVLAVLRARGGKR